MKAGFIGVGLLGRGMARELIRAGHETTVFDVHPEGPAELEAIGANVATSPAAVADCSDVIGVCVRTEKDVMEVLEGEDGLFVGARPGTLILVHSTIRPNAIVDAAKKASARGLRLADAPFSRATTDIGGKNLVYMLGGTEKDLQDGRVFVDPSATEIIFAGGVGAAMALKVCNNIISFAGFMALTEASELAGMSGVDPALLWKVLAANGNATTSMAALLKTRTQGDQVYRQNSAAVAEKDLDCALAQAVEVGVSVPGTELIRRRIRQLFLVET